MNTKNHKSTDIASPWTWPLDITCYDRTPDLTREEEKALEPLVARKKRLMVLSERTHIIPLVPGAPLTRLFQPIYDLWNITHMADPACRESLAVLCQEMLSRQKAYWGWSHEEWCEILGVNSSSFNQRYRRSRNCRRIVFLVSYMLCGFTDLRFLHLFRLPTLAKCVFGDEPVQNAILEVCNELRAWGYSEYREHNEFPASIALLLLANRSPRLPDLTSSILETARNASISTHLKDDLFAISRILVQLGYIEYPLEKVLNKERQDRFGDKLEGVPPEWASWATRWFTTSTLAPRTRHKNYRILIKAGRWIADTCPEKADPGLWTRETAVTFVAAVDRMKIGDWVQTLSTFFHARRKGNPLSAEAKAAHCSALRIFFRDGQEWGWFPRHFDPYRYFATPRSVRALIGPDPRVIADDIWAKLLWAGLNLTEEDVPATNYSSNESGETRTSFYPVEMMRAIVIVWLFAGLRTDELTRLRVGCIRWQREDVSIVGTNEILPKDAVCMLDVPIHKTGTAFTKAVDRAVGDAIAEWERVRPPNQPLFVDRKTSEAVHLLFSYRGRHIGQTYINTTIIPMLCRKANIPRDDARGTITSHRARSTIASQLFNAKEPLSLFDLQEWLGHRLLSSTQYYAKKSPTQVAKAYEKAGYFERNMRTISVLLDQEVVRSGAAATGIPWKFYDLGHGYCAYDFFDQCPHRMACAKCTFYTPKGSTQAQILEGKANLQRMLQMIPLTEDERAAVEDGVTALEKLCQQLLNVPTPSGLTPHQLGTENKTLTFIPVEEILKKEPKG